ncbi:MAG: NUDIX domain-containing protein [Candidatus Jorgensenbacteria bacterium]
MNEDIFHLGIKALIFNKEGKVLLLKVNLEELRGHNGEPYWDIPGGRIRKNDNVENTLRREVIEETGLEISRFEPFTMVVSNIRIPQSDGSDVGLVLSVFKCSAENTDGIILSKEHTDYKWFPKEEAGKLLSVKYPKEFTEKIH